MHFGDKLLARCFKLAEMIRAVILDLGNVIVPFDYNRLYAALTPICVHPAAEISTRIGASNLPRRFETGQVSPEEFVEAISRMLDLEVSYAEFCRIWCSIFLPETWIPESLLKGLRRRYRLLLLSNTNPIHFSMIQENYPLLRHFEDYILSYQVGAMKPSPRIYQEAITRAECRAEECLFADDIPTYVEAARQEGMNAVQFLSLAQFLQELRSRGIEWDDSC